MMYTERAALMGFHAQAKSKIAHLEIQIEVLCREIRETLNPVITPVADLDVNTASTLMDDLSMKYAKLQAEKAQLARIERELG